jgi:pimeloyl-ACP methyl ester carboxylesterase
MNDLEGYTEEDFSFPLSAHISLGPWKTHYLSQEKKNKPVIILLHGIMVNSNVFEHYLDLFSRDYTVYALDFLGHGLSEKKPDLCLADLVEQLRLFMQVKKIEKAVIIGHSLGGLVAGIFASLYPEKLEKLALISSTDYDHFFNDILNTFKGMLIDFMSPFMNFATIPLLYDILTRQVFNHKPSVYYDEDHHITYQLKIKGSQKSLLSLMKNYQYPGFASQHYARIHVPTLVLHGEKDRLVDYEHSKLLAAKIPNAQLHIVPRGSHMLIDENKDAVLSELGMFLETKV